MPYIQRVRAARKIASPVRLYAQWLVSMRYPARGRPALFHGAIDSTIAVRRLSLRNMGTVRPQASCSTRVKLQPKSFFFWALKHCEREVTAVTWISFQDTVLSWN